MLVALLPASHGAHMRGSMENRRELSSFLRAMRDRTRPRHDSERGRRRRAPGLLREEVAEAAGISATWYTWLEQGRPVNPSMHALEGIAKALFLTPTERQHLFTLARPDLAGIGPAKVSRADLRQTADMLTCALAPHPAYALDACWNLLAWNAPASTLFCGFDAEDEIGGNLLRRLFLDPQWRTLFVDWEIVAQSAVAQFRAATAALDSDSGINHLVDGLKIASEEFERYWRDAKVEPAPIWTKAFSHPELGKRRYLYTSMSPTGLIGQMTVSIYFDLSDCNDLERRACGEVKITQAAQTDHPTAGSNDFA